MIGAMVVGIVANVLTLDAEQVAFTVSRSLFIPGATSLLIAAPAAVAGYRTTVVLSHMGVRPERWREAFAILGASLLGGTAGRGE